MTDLTLVTPKQWQELLSQCADEADTIARHYYNSQAFSVSQKGDNSPVTEADQKIESVIRTFICDKYPDMGVVGEEFPDKPSDAAITLFVDPIDGTSNFIRKIPIFGSLLAIAVDKKIVAGVVSNGVANDRWEASLHNGATYNKKPIHVSTLDDIRQSQAFYGSLFGREARGDFQRLTHVLSKSQRQRGIGDFMMHTWVANGYGEFAIDFGLSPWDIAPLGILVTEAGGTVTAVNGEAFDVFEGSILSSNGQFHDTLVQLYNQD